MKTTKPKPVIWCEVRMLNEPPIYAWMNVSHSCGKPAKAIRYFSDDSHKPMYVCGVHARMFRKRGYRVEDIK